MRNWLICSILLVSSAACCPQPQVVTKVVRPEPCAHPYDAKMALEPWDRTRSLGHPVNAQATVNNINYLIHQTQLRDTTIKCYEDQLAPGAPK